MPKRGKRFDQANKVQAFKAGFRDVYTPPKWFTSSKEFIDKLAPKKKDK